MNPQTLIKTFKPNFLHINKQIKINAKAYMKPKKFKSY